VIISHFIWEQEIGNRNFILQNGLGFYEPKPKKLAEKVQKLLTNNKELTIIQKNYQKVKLENGLADLAEFITQHEL
jgi:processive 1,2-diacylglycerol beta-glucosyltransferase/1,2-diacylglycerol 3-beta-galactosyltransferase